jgi:hypothetical protein
MVKVCITFFHQIIQNPIKCFIQAFICITFLLSSCAKCDETRVEGGYLVISFIDSSSGKYIYTPINSLLSQDSLQIIDDNGKPINFIFVESVPGEEKHLVVGVYFLWEENALVQKSFSIQQCKSVNINLSSQKKARYTICFTSKTVNCGSVFQSLTITKDGKRIPIVKGLESATFTEKL